MAVEEFSELERSVFVKRMTPEDRTLFDVMTPAHQDAYMQFWAQRPDRHASHRDTMPAFLAGLLYGAVL